MTSRLSKHCIAFKIIQVSNWYFNEQDQMKWFFFWLDYNLNVFIKTVYLYNK